MNGYENLSSADAGRLEGKQHRLRAYHVEVGNQSDEEGMIVIP